MLWIGKKTVLRQLKYEIGTLMSVPQPAILSPMKNI